MVGRYSSLNSTSSRIQEGTNVGYRRRPPSHNVLGDVRGVFRGGLNHDIRTGAPGALQFCVLETRCITTHTSKGVRARTHATVSPESDGIHSMGLLSSPIQKFLLCPRQAPQRSERTHHNPAGSFMRVGLKSPREVAPNTSCGRRHRPQPWFQLKSSP